VVRTDAPTISQKDASIRPLQPEKPAVQLRLLPSDGTPAGTQHSSRIGRTGNALLELPWLVWNLFDILVMSIGLYVGYSWFAWSPEGAWVGLSWGQTWIIQSITFILAGLIFGLYEKKTLLRRSRIVARSVLSVITAVALTYIVIYLFMYSTQSRRVLMIAAGVYLLLAGSFRLTVCSFVSQYSRNFLIVGTDRKSQLTPNSQGDALSRRYRLAGYVALDPIEIGREIDGYPVLGTIDQITHICKQYHVSEVVVGRAAAKNSWMVDRTLKCLELGCRVTNLSTFYEEVLSEVPATLLEPNWFLFADLKHYNEAQLIIKRAIDILSSLFGLAVTLPFWPIVALLIKLDSQGPVFYSQTRVGLNGRLFKLYKFRTMHIDSERNGHTWAAPNDPRVTTIGRYLRKSRIDELPQLWNVLLGTMSVVGPRPERPEFVEELASQIRFYNERHLVKPGLTGWAQINYRYGASVADAQRKLQLDLWYIKHMSIELDLTVILRTMGTVFLGSR
jgi:exopolysaccharide biosynthesis polyprenyl glycosylphosphotransferase